MEMEPCRSPGEDWCRKQPNVATFQRHDVDVVGKTEQTLSHKEAIKGTGESNFGGSKKSLQYLGSRNSGLE